MPIDGGFVVTRPGVTAGCVALETGVAVVTGTLGADVLAAGKVDAVWEAWGTKVPRTAGLQTPFCQLPRVEKPKIPA